MIWPGMAGWYVWYGVEQGEVWCKLRCGMI